MIILIYYIIYNILILKEGPRGKGFLDKRSFCVTTVKFFSFLN